MKKIISLVLMLAMLLSVSAFAEETFTVHNGVTFGMSKREVKELEKAEDYSDNIVVADVDDLAGISGYSSIYYTFENNKLIQAKYSFPCGSELAMHQSVDEVRSDYRNLSSLLQSKYGPTDHSSLTGKIYSLPTMKEKTRYSAFGEADYWKQPSKAWAKNNYAVETYEEWIVVLPDGSGVYIHHCLFYNKNDSNNETYHNLYYSLFDAKTISEVVNVANNAVNDI